MARNERGIYNGQPPHAAMDDAERGIPTSVDALTGSRWAWALGGLVALGLTEASIELITSDMFAQWGMRVAAGIGLGLAARSVVHTLGEVHQGKAIHRVRHGHI